MGSFRDLPPNLPVPEDDGAGGMRLYKRLTLIAQASAITDVVYPVFPPGSDAAKAVALLADAR